MKNCPNCESRVAVATKSCKCGYSFFETRRSLRIAEALEEADELRRTSRVRREKPNYYDSQQFDKKKKKGDTKVSTFCVYLAISADSLSNLILCDTFKFKFYLADLYICFSLGESRAQANPAIKKTMTKMHHQPYAQNENVCASKKKVKALIYVQSKNSRII